MTRWEAVKKVLKPHHLIILIVLLASNSFAWFIYATKVNNEMSAHVSAWEVLFEAGDSPITDYINVKVDNMYPGMEEFQYELNAYNKSEVGAVLTYTLLEVNLMGEKYISKEGRGERQESEEPNDLTSKELIEKLKNDYPFTFSFFVSSTALDAQIGSATYKINLAWPFESGDDKADTLWGIKAANYKKTHPNSSSIVLKIKIHISQLGT